MKKSTKITILLIGVLALVALVVSLKIGNLKNDTLEKHTTSTNNSIDEDQQRPALEVQQILIPKNAFEGGVQDLKLSVGTVYGNFTISNILDESRSPDVIKFSGEETLTGTLQYSSFPALVFTPDTGEETKLPQIFKDIYDHSVITNSLVINEPSAVSPKDFVFDEGNSKPRHVEVRITNIRMIAPPIDGFGSADIISVKYLEK